MTVNPVSIPTSYPLDGVIKQLLSSIFTGIPVIDKDERPVGIITQSDLIYKVKLPIKLSILPEEEKTLLDKFLLQLPEQSAMDIMTQPAIIIDQDKMLMEAVAMMVKNNVKRLPVVDAGGKIVGVLSRMDIFSAITREFPDWSALKYSKISLSHPNIVSDVMRQDTLTVSLWTSVEEVINLVNINDLEAVAVVTETGKLKGMIFEHDLLKLFTRHKISIWNYLREKIHRKKSGPKIRSFFKKINKMTAKEIMKTDLITIHEQAGIDEAISLITDNKIKRLPVVDDDGNFRGLINRESLLRVVIHHES
jgi:CBS domain-containing protein